jgi:hypothetical protein
MAHFYIEPRYNSGERVAGGKLAIYTNESMQNFCDLYRVADFNNPVEGTTAAEFLIANPVPIDNNGINTSPIFLDLDVYPEAYYVLYDANGAVIRQGYLVPMSWQGGGQPPEGGDGGWSNSLVGDPFWGYEIITGINSGTNPLTGKATTIGRPLFLTTGTTGDKSGGLVIWAVPQGNLQIDNILTFDGNNGKIWKAREEFINYSYLAQTQSNPFSYIDNLNSANGWNYGIRLDVAPSNVMGSYNSKLLIDSPINGTYTSNNVYSINLSREENLIITCPLQVFNFSGNGNVPFLINVKGGSFNTRQILDNNGNNVIIGYVSELANLTSNANLKDLTIGKLMNGNNAFGFNGWQTDKPIENFYLTAFSMTTSWNASDLANLKIEKLISDLNNCTINLDADINFETVGDYSINLTDNAYENSPNAYFIKSSKCFTVDYTFYAKNAELYNVCQFNSTVKVNSGVDANNNGSGDLPAVISNNLVQLGSECSGKIILNSTNSKKLYLCSRTVEVEGDVWNENYFIYLGNAWGNLKKVNALLDFNVMSGSSINNNNSTKEYRTYGSTARQCRFYVGSDYAPIIVSNGVIFEQSEIIDSHFAIFGCAVAFSQTKARKCEFWGMTNYKQVDNYAAGVINVPSANNSFIWQNSVCLYNDSEITGSRFCRCQIIPVNDYKNQMRNIHFDSNEVFDDGRGYYITYNDKDDNPKNIYAIIRMLSDRNFIMDDWGSRNSSNYVNLIPSDDVSSIKIENVTFKANLRNGDGAGFSMFSPSVWPPRKNRALQGHIEITGDYNYNFTSKMGTDTIVTATETFPPWESAIDYWYNRNNGWTDGSTGFISNLCLFVPGDPVKYTTHDGRFISVDPFREQTINDETYWGWDYSYPVPRTKGVDAYVWSSEWTDEETGESGTVTGTTIVPINCLLCCECDVRLYRIRE